VFKAAEPLAVRADSSRDSPSPASRVVNGTLWTMAITTAEDQKGGPYQDCSCKSGKKFRFCHGEKSPASEFTGIHTA